MNIVSLAPESKKVGTFPFWNPWNHALISAVVGISRSSLSNTLIFQGSLNPMPKEQNARFAQE